MQDACSLLDAVFREIYSGSKNKSNLTMEDFHSVFEARYSLSKTKSLLFQIPLQYATPFKDWAVPDGRLSWWGAYNDLKHDRLGQYKQATLSNAVLALCALHQVLSLAPEFLGALVRRDMVHFGQWGERYALEAVHASDNDKVTILIETTLFATPIGAYRFPNEVGQINPFIIGKGKRLWRFLGTNP